MFKLSDLPLRIRFLIMAALGLGALILLSYWAGFPQELFSVFLIGLLLLALALTGFVWLSYHLFARPLSVGHKNPTVKMLPSPFRRLLVIVLGISGMCVTVGGFWDEVWHRAYGLPFGPDLFWRPHILIYLGLLTPPILGSISFIFIMRRGKGTMQQRFRADPTLGYLIMVGLLLGVAEPLDPVWHTIYGSDISAWSLPHLVLLIASSLVIFLAAYILHTSIQPMEWKPVWRASLFQWLLIILFTFSLTTQLQVLITDWESTNSMVFDRPSWLLPVLFIFLATFNGRIIGLVTKTLGGATISAVLAIGIRYGLSQAFSYPVPVDAWLPLIAPVIGVDIWQALRVKSSLKISNPWLTSLAATTGMVFISFPLINRLFSFLSLEGGTIISTAIFCLVVGAVGGWIGQAIGNGLINTPRQVEVESPVYIKLRYLAPVLFSASVVFIIYFIVTATPPA